jgi:pimeloyl-ACP methyl ester carboxylesterase
VSTTGASFGSEAALRQWDAFYTVATESRGLSRRPALIGVSRGGLFIHRWAAANPDKVSCLVGVAPVCDIKSRPAGRGLSGGHGAGWKELLAAYGMTEQQALAWDGNPIDLVAPVAKARIPVLHVYCPQDEGVPYEENTKVYAEKLTAAGGVFVGLPIEIPRDSIKGKARLEAEQKKVDAKNPQAVAGAHRKTCAASDPKIVEFIRKAN